MIESTVLINQYYENGDERAILMIMDLYYDALTQYGLKHLSDMQIVEDCIQEVLIDLWSKRKKLAPIHNFKSYLFVSVRHRILKKARQVKKEQYNQTYLGVEGDMTSFEFSYEDKIIQQQKDEETRKRLHQALCKLTSKQREVIYLRFYQQLDYESITKNLGIKNQSTKNLLSEALKSLRKNFIFCVFGIFLFIF